MRFSGFQELLEHYAAVSPDAPALIYEDREKKGLLLFRFEEACRGKG